MVQVRWSAGAFIYTHVQVRSFPGATAHLQPSPGDQSCSNDLRSAAARTNRAFDTGTRIFTIKSFPSATAVRATDARAGIDHCSTNNSTTCAVQSISIRFAAPRWAATACEKTPGQYSNTVRNLFDYIQKWTNARF